MSEPPAPKRPTPARKPARTARATPARRPRRAPPVAVQAVVFSLAGEEYALPVAQVAEVLSYVKPRSIGARVPWVRGVISLRGAVVPVCDLAARLGLDAGREPFTRIVVVPGPQGPIGLLVGEVREVVTIAPEQLDALRVTSDPAVTGIATLGERLVVLLDAAVVLADAGLAAPARAR